MRVADIQGATAGGEAGIVAEFGIWNAAPDGQGTGRVSGSLQGVGEWQASVLVTHFFGGLVIHHCFAGALGHCTTAEGAVVARSLREITDGLLNRAALAVFRQLRQQLPASGGVDALEQRNNALLLCRGRCRRGIQPRQPLQQGRRQLAAVAVEGALEQLLRMFTMAGIQRQVGSLVE
ncbi:hypothetical protein D3C87_1180950 [compost metagenome]